MKYPYFGILNNEVLFDFIPEILDEHPSTFLLEGHPLSTGPRWVHLSTGSAEETK